MKLCLPIAANLNLVRHCDGKIGNEGVRYGSFVMDSLRKAAVTA